MHYQDARMKQRDSAICSAHSCRLPASFHSSVSDLPASSASRLEGVTRVYHLPVIVSEYVKTEVEQESARYKFIEIDTIQVKGKTEGKKIFFPFDTNEMEESLFESYKLFETGLKAYYEGDWKSARKILKETGLEVAEVFIERMGNKNAPEDWSGIWTMTSK